MESAYPNCICLLGLPSKDTSQRVAYTTEIYFFTDLEAGNLRSRYLQRWFLLRAVSKGSVQALCWACWQLSSPWVSISSSPVCFQISSSYVVLGPILKSSFSLDYLCKDFTSECGHSLNY